MDTDNDDASNPSLEKAEPNTGESLHLFIKMLNLDAINIELETAKFSSDIFKICILLDEKLNQLDSIKFSSPQDKSELFEELNNLLEKARGKYRGSRSLQRCVELFEIGKKISARYTTFCIQTSSFNF
ncbi:hypothetical protein NPIL_126361 [Nephila pilipes]|uniref:Uncharacterized protein n=1 Tax=Nephila pilipes TaxID=299642 RepID=A0A8X6N6C1_NEPPI|nr:hypothetical protein NPIL_126361 [Nephila pilipes]